MIKGFTICCIFTLCFSMHVFSQSPETNSFGGIEGQLSAGTNGKAVFASIGGATLKFIFKKFNVGVSMGPALKFEQLIGSKVDVVPVVGIGPQIYFLKNKRLCINFNTYYLTAKKEWTLSAGLGYVFTKSK